MSFKEKLIYIYILITINIPVRVWGHDFVSVSVCDTALTKTIPLKLDSGGLKSDQFRIDNVDVPSGLARGAIQAVIVTPRRSAVVELHPFGQFEQLVSVMVPSNIASGSEGPVGSPKNQIAIAVWRRKLLSLVRSHLREHPLLQPVHLNLTLHEKELPIQVIPFQDDPKKADAILFQRHRALVDNYRQYINERWPHLNLQNGPIDPTAADTIYQGGFSTVSYVRSASGKQWVVKIPFLLASKDDRTYANHVRDIAIRLDAEAIKFELFEHYLKRMKEFVAVLQGLMLSSRSSLSAADQSLLCDFITQVTAPDVELLSSFKTVTLDNGSIRNNPTDDFSATGVRLSPAAFSATLFGHKYWLRTRSGDLGAYYKRYQGDSISARGALYDEIPYPVESAQAPIRPFRRYAHRLLGVTPHYAGERVIFGLIASFANWLNGIVPVEEHRHFASLNRLDRNSVPFLGGFSSLLAVNSVPRFLPQVSDRDKMRSMALGHVQRYPPFTRGGPQEFQYYLLDPGDTFGNGRWYDHRTPSADHTKTVIRQIFDL